MWQRCRQFDFSLSFSRTHGCTIWGCILNENVVQSVQCTLYEIQYTKYIVHTNTHHICEHNRYCAFHTLRVVSFTRFFRYFYSSKPWFNIRCVRARQVVYSIHTPMSYSYTHKHAHPYISCVSRFVYRMYAMPYIRNENEYEKSE